MMSAPPHLLGGAAAGGSSLGDAPVTAAGSLPGTVHPQVTAADMYTTAAGATAQSAAPVAAGPALIARALNSTCISPSSTGASMAPGAVGVDLAAPPAGGGGSAVGLAGAGGREVFEKAGFMNSSSSSSTNSTNPYLSLFRMARQAPVATFREALLQERARQRQLLVQQQPQQAPEEIDRQVQEQLRSSLVDRTSFSTILFETAQRSQDEEAVALTHFLVEEIPVVDPTQRDRMQQDCLFYAAREGHVRLCEYLLRHGCTPNARDTVGQTCLFYAAREGRAAAIAVLIDAGGASPNVLDINRQTCLFYAARDNRVDAVRVLLARGADPHIKDALRKTAWHFARANNHTTICNILKAAGGSGGAVQAALGGGGGGGAPASSSTLPLFHHVHQQLPSTSASASAVSHIPGAVTLASTPATPTQPAAAASSLQQYSALGEDLAAARRSSSGSGKGGSVDTSVTDQASTTSATSVGGGQYPSAAPALVASSSLGAPCATVTAGGAIGAPSLIGAAAAGGGQGVSVWPAEQPHAPTATGTDSHAEAKYFASAGRKHRPQHTQTEQQQQQQPPRRKYRLQFQPLPEEQPDLWLFAGNEKLTEFERLFPTLCVWQKSEIRGAGPSHTSTRAAGSSSAPKTEEGEGRAATAESHYESVHWALMQSSAQKHAQQHLEGQQQHLDIVGRWHAAASALLSQLSRYEGGHIFEKPVDPKTAPGYYDVVTRPMSLSTIKSKLKKNEYMHPSQFLQDVEQVFINCEIYNQCGTWVWSIGKNMQKFFANRVRITNFKEYVDVYDKINNVLAACQERNLRHFREQQQDSSSSSVVATVAGGGWQAPCTEPAASSSGTTSSTTTSATATSSPVSPSASAASPAPTASAISPPTAAAPAASVVPSLSPAPSPDGANAADASPPPTSAAGVPPPPAGVSSPSVADQGALAPSTVVPSAAADAAIPAAPPHEVTALSAEASVPSDTGSTDAAGAASGAGIPAAPPAMTQGAVSFGFHERSLMSEGAASTFADDPTTVSLVEKNSFSKSAEENNVRAVAAAPAAGDATCVRAEAIGMPNAVAPSSSSTAAAAPEAVDGLPVAHEAGDVVASSVTDTPAAACASTSKAGASAEGEIRENGLMPTERLAALVSNGSDAATNVGGSVQVSTVAQSEAGHQPNEQQVTTDQQQQQGERHQNQVVQQVEQQVEEQPQQAEQQQLKEVAEAGGALERKRRRTENCKP